MWHFKASYLLNKISFLNFFLTFDSIAKCSFKTTKPVLPIKKNKFLPPILWRQFPPPKPLKSKKWNGQSPPPLPFPSVPVPYHFRRLLCRLGHFLCFCFQEWNRPGKILDSDILDRTGSFLDYKNTFEKKLENWSFHNFGQKTEISP